MSRDNDLPFPRGKTYFGSGTPVTTAGDSSYDFEGREYLVDDVIYTPGSTYGQLRSRDKVTLRVVRNSSGFALLPKRLVAFMDGTHWGRRVAGYTISHTQKGALVDEYLPATGVADGDLFYVVMDGPATGTTNLASATSNIYTYGAIAFALTVNTTSGATTAGRLRVVTSDVTTFDSSATDYSLLFNTLKNYVGHAMTTTAVSTNTAADILVRVRRMI